MKQKDIPLFQNVVHIILLFKVLIGVEMVHSYNQLVVLMNYYFMLLKLENKIQMELKIIETNNMLLIQLN